TIQPPPTAPGNPGDVDLSFSANITYFGGPGRVEAMAPQSCGKILIGGQFSHVDGVPCNGIARLNSDGSLDTSFISPFYEAAVHAIALQSDGGILVGGELYLSNQ